MNAQENFLSDQLRFKRVEKAYQNKYALIKNIFKEKNLTFPPKELLFISYKAEGELQIWTKENEYYQLVNVYKVCQKSGDFGPKRFQGDRQVPEGFYKINIFNPLSNFHLSLGINYPNEADKIKSKAIDKGGDIYIHGNCVTIGCLPMTDDLIEEIYLLSVLAKNEGQSEIPIYLFPFKYNKLTEYIFYKEYPEFSSFWDTLKSEYIYFNKNKKIRNYNIDENGNYFFLNK